MLLTPAEPLSPLPDNKGLTQAQALELWLDDVAAFHRLRARYTALQGWYATHCSMASAKETRVTVKTWEPGRMK